MHEGLDDSRARAATGNGAPGKGLMLGLIAGLLATVAIDLITVGVLPLVGLPAEGGFSVIGDTAAGFLSLVGIDITGGVPASGVLAGGVPLGVVLHYLVGLALGAIFGAAVTRVDALRLDSFGKGIGLSILYTEVISLPILATPPVILKWPLSTAAQWFGFSFFMHTIWGSVLGAVVKTRAAFCLCGQARMI